jgi:hypothetical protein
METIKKFENYPWWIVVLSNVVSLSIYALGFLILFRLGPVYSFVYLFYILLLEGRLIKNHCTKCFYWGKTCGFGKGRVSSWVFKKGDTSEFCAKEMTWKNMIPDAMVSLIPVIIGIVLLILRFDIIILSALLLVVFFTTSGNGFIRGKLICKYCKQSELGCPAQMLFNKQKTGENPVNA